MGKKSRSFYSQLKKKVISRVLAGDRKLLLCGYNSTCVRLLKELNSLGFQDRIAGVVDLRCDAKRALLLGLEVLPKEGLEDIEPDCLVICEDALKEESLVAMSECISSMPNVVVSGSDNYAFHSQLYSSILASSPVRSLAGGYPNMLIHIFQSLEYLVRNTVKGNVSEFGVYQGGTLYVIAQTLRRLGWAGRIIGFDLFNANYRKRSMLDIFPLNTYESDYDTVNEYCRRYQVELVAGDICDTFVSLIDVPLMFSFFDTDFYSPTRAALELVYQQTSVGGIIAFDHVYSKDWEETLGERIAANEVLSCKGMLNLHGTGIFIKCS